MDFELSRMHAGAMEKTLVEIGKRVEVFELISPEARAAFSDPHTARWHDGRFAVECWSALVTVGGKPLLEEYNYQMTRKSFGPIVGPLIRMGMTLSGSGPTSMFSRLKDLTSLAVRGVAFQWKQLTPNSGTQTITYPCPVPADVIEAAWKGVFRVGSELIGKPIRIDRFEAEIDRGGRFDVSW